jgi:citrate lyase subunit beta / citryl-CoA lyase
MTTAMARLGRIRSMLFAPAVRPDFIAKLPTLDADAVVIDCEDSTPADAKRVARDNARLLVAGIRRPQQAVLVRVNAPSTEWFEDDLRNAISAAVAAVVIPKVEQSSDLDRAASILDDVGFGQIGVFAGIETALGVADARSLLRHPRVVGAYFGAEDFVADMGGIRTEGNSEVAHARATVVLAARLSGRPAVDQAVIDHRAGDRFAREITEARAWGYSGKLCIHPRQVPLANRGFMPTAEELARAERLLAAYDAASRAGQGAIDFEGQMIDEPLAAQARRVVALSEGRAAEPERPDDSTTCPDCLPENP